MKNHITLDKLREDVSSQFAPLKVGLSDGSEVTLRNLLRLGKKDRETVMDKLKVLESVGDKDGLTINELDQLTETANEVLVLVAADNGGRRLVKELDGDFALTIKVVEQWMEATQPGEAPDSPN